MNFFSRLRREADAHNFTCDLCGREVFANERICAVCDKNLPKNDGAICPLCGRRVGEAGICLDCKEKPPLVERARSALVHEGEAARLVVRFKRGQKYLVRALCDLMEPVMRREFPDAELIAFVPMTERARRRRGYNQSRLIAEELSRRTGVPVFAGLEKERETDAQKFLGRREREENLAGSFHLADRRSVRGKRVLVVDDTLTTGATVNEIARLLYGAGAVSVCALTATSVERKHPFGRKDAP